MAKAPSFRNQIYPDYGKTRDSRPPTDVHIYQTAEGFSGVVVLPGSSNPLVTLKAADPSHSQAILDGFIAACRAFGEAWGYRPGRATIHPPFGE